MKAKYNVFKERIEFAKQSNMVEELFNDTLDTFHCYVCKFVEDGLPVNLAFCKVVSEVTPGLVNSDLVFDNCDRIGITDDEEKQFMVELYNGISLAIFDSYLEFIKTKNPTKYKKLKGTLTISGSFTITPCL
ncbi:hypothetical protein [Aquitalea pelogenes]|uniref:hypothetical protein n=1 Tax=Aquitalea pelogenes TaxID=1293573 RepID=UPI0035AF4E9D